MEYHYIVHPQLRTDLYWQVARAQVSKGARVNIWKYKCNKILIPFFYVC